MDAKFFRSATEFRRWLESHHSTADELWVGFYKKAASRRGITYAEAVDESLCFGWIDGIRKRIDEERYANRFTPRKPRSNWSDVNTRRVAELTAAGRMHPAGLAAFQLRDESRAGVYSFENRAAATLTPMQEARFRKSARAWTFFEAQPPGYRKTAIWWVVSAKREQTREKRLTTLIDDSANGLRIAMLRR
ncbi:MAG TPA: YdeI/OmpD-associated family protein [Thermoanaerobaculia bacterium]